MDASTDTGSAATLGRPLALANPAVQVAAEQAPDAGLLEQMAERLRLATERLQDAEAEARAEQLKARIRDASVTRVERANETFLVRLRASGPTNDAA